MGSEEETREVINPQDMNL